MVGVDAVQISCCKPPTCSSAISADTNICVQSRCRSPGVVGTVTRHPQGDSRGPLCFARGTPKWEAHARNTIPQVRAHDEDVFSEAVVQYVAETFAQDFNRRKTPRKVAFVTCHVLRLDERRGRPLCCVEPELPGRFEKHNNNFGGNFTADPTPGAFGHFTWEASNRLLLVCDLQVSDVCVWGLTKEEALSCT